MVVTFALLQSLAIPRPIAISHSAASSFCMTKRSLAAWSLLISTLSADEACLAILKATVSLAVPSPKESNEPQRTAMNKALLSH